MRAADEWDIEWNTIRKISYLQLCARHSITLFITQVPFAFIAKGKWFVNSRLAISNTWKVIVILHVCSYGFSQGWKSLQSSSCNKQYSCFHALANWKCDVDTHKFLRITQTVKVTCFFVPSTEPSSYIWPTVPYHCSDGKCTSLKEWDKNGFQF